MYFIVVINSLWISSKERKDEFCIRGIDYFVGKIIIKEGSLLFLR